MKRTVLSLAASMISLAGCAPTPEAVPAKDFSGCAGAKSAMKVMQTFITAFNAKDIVAVEKTFHFPHMRIAAYPLHVLTGPGQQDDVFGSLAAENWAKSRWDDLTIVQCGPEKAHILGSFARLHPDGTEYARYDGLYVVELRDGFWGITARSTFAP